jgi:CBS-domain-containing membrane protein
MNENPKKRQAEFAPPLDISDDDVYEAMKEVEGYLDITPSDFKLLYGIAFRHAVLRLTQAVKASDVMTRKVISVSKDTPLVEVTQIMAVQHISGVPVVDAERKVIGVISEKDFIFHMGGENIRSFMGVVAHCLKSKGCVALPMRHQKAEDVMTHPAITVKEDTLTSQVAETLTTKNINRVPVVDQEGKLIGIVARTDMVQTFCTILVPPTNQSKK